MKHKGIRLYPLSLSATSSFVVCASASRLLAGEPTHNDGCRATCAGAYLYRCRRAIHGASPALHAGVLINDARSAAVYLKHPVRAYLAASPAANAFFPV